MKKNILLLLALCATQGYAVEPQEREEARKERTDENLSEAGKKRVEEIREASKKRTEEHLKKMEEMREMYRGRGGNGGMQIRIGN